MFARPRQKQLTKAEKRAARIEREARAFAAKGAAWLVDKHVTRDDPFYVDLSDDAFQAKREQEREHQESLLLSQARYRFGEKGQIEDRITDELTRRCGNEKLAQEFVRQIDGRSRAKKTLMEILVKLLQNHELCRGSDVRREWEEFLEPYLGSEVVALMRTLRELECQTAEAERRAEEEARMREEETRLRVEADQRNAELMARLARYEGGPGLFDGRGAEDQGAGKRSATPRDENPDEGKKARGAETPPPKRGL